MPGLRPFLSAAALVCASTLISLAAAEFAARLIVHPADFLQVSLVDDPILGYRIAPFTAGRDSFGYRNASIPQQAEIVAIGDSQTEGVRVTREDSWPQQLARLSGRPVYTMALGGYGPLEYLYLLQHLAPKLHPKQIVVGFYFGNDLLDACVAVARRAYWSGWRTEPGDVCAVPPEPQRQFGPMRDWIARHIVLYGLAKAAMAPLVTRLKDHEARHEAPDRELLWVDPANPAVHTIFTPQYRYMALDLATPGVRDGLRITKRAFAEMRDAAASQGVPLLMVLLPTKEAVYCPRLKQLGVMLPQAFTALCRAEAQIKHELTGDLAGLGLRYLDAEPALQAGVAERMPLYPTDDDGHPVAAGYTLIAKAVYDELTAR